MYVSITIGKYTKLKMLLEKFLFFNKNILAFFVNGKGTSCVETVEKRELLKNIA